MFSHGILERKSASPPGGIRQVQPVDNVNGMLSLVKEKNLE